ncbi:Protein of unknown function DUF111 [Natronorubrum thiooxidans]|uniref:Uncharacterized protein n=1 Tax=Natronorubrum thiooxidans TaxID=308853 RepID=A0A1N7FRP2_9EURY|nr:Protein of unknown function DUF111 [Natronorubrum thiooxidans]
MLVSDRSGRDELVKDDIAVLETHLDDTMPEILGWLRETLADSGARDVYLRLILGGRCFRPNTLQWGI